MANENKNQTGILVKDTDKFFYTSPDSGHPDCLCSRCGKAIPENQSPILRMWPTDPGDYGFDPKASGGTEFRYCWQCCEGMGLEFGNPDDFEIDDKIPNAF